MAKHHFNKILYILILSFLFSCEKQYDIPQKFAETKLVVNSLVGVDSTINVQVSSTFPLTDVYDEPPITDALVQIKDNNKSYKLTYNNESYSYKTNAIKLVAGKSYSLSVSTNYDQLATATETMPQPVSILAADTFHVPGDPIRIIQVKIRFKDNWGTKDYYILNASAQLNYSKKYSYESNIEVYSHDPVFENHLVESEGLINRNLLTGSRVFTDYRFQGKEKELIFYVLRSKFPSGTNAQLIVHFNTISKNYFHYERSFIQQKNTKRFPLYKKVNLYSNFPNTFGIFAAYNANRIIIPINNDPVEQ